MKPQNHDNRKWSWNSIEFTELHEIYWNSMQFHEVHNFLVKWWPLRPLGWKHWCSQGMLGGFGGPLDWKMRKVTWFQYFHGKVWEFTKFRYFTRKTCFCGISAFLAARAPQNHQYSLRNINDFNHGGARAPIYRKVVNFTEFNKLYWNFMKFPGIHIFLVKRRPFRPHGWNHW